MAVKSFNSVCRKLYSQQQQQQQHRNENFEAATFSPARLGYDIQKAFNPNVKFG
jgi:hypothetical protein